MLHRCAPVRWDLTCHVSPKTKAEIIASGRERSPAWAEVEFGPWAEAKLQVGLNVFGLVTALGAWRDIVSKITCPALLVTADPEAGAIVTPETAKTVTEANSNVKVAHVAGAGHNIRREQFEPFVKVVTAFLQNG